MTRHRVPTMAQLGVDTDPYVLEKRINRVRVVLTIGSVVTQVLSQSTHRWQDASLTGLLAATATVVGLVLTNDPSKRALRALGASALAADSLACLGFMWSEVNGQEGSLWSLTIPVIFEAAMRYGLSGGMAAGTGGGLVTVAWSIQRGIGAATTEKASLAIFRFVVLLAVGAGTGSAFQRLHRQNRAFSQALRLSRDLVWVLARDGTILYLNDVSSDVLGWTPAELVGHNFAELSHPEGRDGGEEGGFHTENWRGDYQALVRAADGDGVLVLRHLRSDGATVWLEHSVTSAEGRDLIQFVSRDVTATYETVGQLEIIDQRYRSMFEENPDLVFAMDPDGTITAVNHACHRLLGYQPEELAGTSIRPLVPADRLDELVATMTRVLRGESNTFEATAIHKDGDPIEFLVTALPISVDGKVRGVFAIAKDQTDRIAAQREQAKLLEEIRQSGDRLRMTLEDSDTVGFQFDIKSQKLQVSDNFASLYELDESAAERMGQGFMEHVHPEDVPRLLATMTGSLVVSNHRFDEIVRVIDGRQRVRLVNVRCRSQLDASGDPARMIGIAVDVSDRERATEQLRQSESAFRSTIEATSDGFIGMNAEGVITDWNVAAEGIFGWSRQEALGRTVIELVVPADLRRSHRAAIERVLERTNHGGLPNHDRRIETTAMRRDGTRFPVEVTVTSVVVAGELCFRAFARDITDRKQTQAALERQALIDALTGLPNRTLLMDRMNHAVARLRRQPSRLAVLFVDVDRFKIVNDSLGHGAGDMFLRELGDRLPAAVRTNDTVARFGGDELVVLCEHVSGSGEAAEIAERVLASISTPLVLDEREIVLTASIGIVMTGDANVNPEDLIRDADAAMYQAKGRGRGRIELFDDSMRIEAVTSLNLDRGLRHALERKQLRLRFQPVVSLGSETMVAAEALVRWDHPELGVLGAADFITRAEETGLIIPIGDWILDEACRNVAAWRGDPSLPEDIAVLVNMSASQLAQPDLAASVHGRLGAYGLDSSALGIEMTESTLIDRQGPWSEQLEALRRMEVKVYIDDFGTGYSSLVYLSRYPVSGIKIDKDFVAAIATDAAGAPIVESIVNLAHSLDLEVVAEGVETREQLEFLTDLGCDNAQGYFWSSAREAYEIPGMAAELARAKSERPPLINRGRSEKRAGQPMRSGTDARQAPGRAASRR